MALTLPYVEELQSVWPQVGLDVQMDSTLAKDSYRIYTKSSVYVVVAGSQYAADKGCARLLYELGFRFYSPQHTFRPPATDPPPVKLRDTVHWRARLFLAYAHDRRFDEGRRLLADFDRWTILVGMHSDYEPVGHSWRNIRLRLERAGQLPEGLFDGDTLNLDHPEAVSAVVADRVDLLQTMQQQDPNHYMVSIEAADSDTTPSDRFYTWVNAVAQGVRVQIPGAVVSTYAYAGHRNPPGFDLEFNVFVQVAIGFSTGNYPTYDALIEAWTRRCQHVGLREYVSVQAWDHGYPGQSRAADAEYWADKLPERRELGCDVWRGEVNANWMVNMYGVQVLVQTLLLGECDHEAVLGQMSAHVFSEDGQTPNDQVCALYGYWAARPHLNPFLFDESYRLISEIGDTDLRDAVMLAYDRWRHGESYFEPEYEDLLAKSATLMPRDIVHSYAMQRRIANGVIVNVRPELWMFNDPLPEWYSRGTEFTDEEFEEERARLEAQTQLPDFDNQLRIVDNPTTNPLVAPPVVSRHGMVVRAIGPCKIHIGDRLVQVPAGGHRYKVPGGEAVEFCRGQGTAAIEMRPEDPPWLDAIVGGNAWLWHIGGDLLVDGSPRITLLIDYENGTRRHDVLTNTREPGMTWTRLTGVPEGLMVVHGINLRGLVAAYSTPPYMQLRNDKLLLPINVFTSNSEASQ